MCPARIFLLLPVVRAGYFPWFDRDVSSTWKTDSSEIPIRFRGLICSRDFVHAGCARFGVYDLYFGPGQAQSPPLIHSTRFYCWWMTRPMSSIPRAHVYLLFFSAFLVLLKLSDGEGFQCYPHQTFDTSEKRIGYLKLMSIKSTCYRVIFVRIQ